MAQQYLVPQFIDVEDKIFGPITVRQFIIMIVALVMGAIEYQLFSFVIFIIVVLPTVGGAATIAFARINGRPIHYFILNFVQTKMRPTSRVWNKEAYVMGVQEVKSAIVEEAKAPKPKSMIARSRLQDLTLVLNTGGVYRTDDDIINDTIPRENVAPPLPKNKR